MRALKLAEIPAVSRRLIEQLPAPVDHVLYVEEGALLIGREIARQLGCGSSGVTARRKGQGFKKLVAPLIALLPQRITHVLRGLELRSGVHRKRSERHVHLPEPLPPSARILLVDDAVDTGHSLLAVVEFLADAGVSRENIVTAAITVTSPDLVYTPHVFVYSELMTFPWSAGSEEFGRYRDAAAAARKGP